MIGVDGSDSHHLGSGVIQGNIFGVTGVKRVNLSLLDLTNEKAQLKYLLGRGAYNE